MPLYINQLSLCSPFTNSLQAYWYMKRSPVKGANALYSEYTGGPKILQDYRWDCLVCASKPRKFLSPFKVLKSNRHSVTTSMNTHLQLKHYITSNSYKVRLLGYTQGPGEYIENNWSGEKKN